MTQSNNNSVNFWTSLPGIITAFTSLVVALGGGLTYFFKTPIPSGSYQGTCISSSLKGNTLSAECKDSNGQYQKTSYKNFKDCSNDLTNNNGTLECR
ncbi:MAG: hypothetical protein HWQ38_14285 [Nostoc sp. NMS7]|uniref:hypothetical protein n=1 Tax=Nostoc sp. NMS7 TaxID=2815391 RepID=UPI0025F53175|nr:hypothetical protein [Nostoc sp. NMS7]MBN3947565.1 hypothetical protein [Nostoc sp. NMS7]